MKNRICRFHYIIACCVCFMAFQPINAITINAPSDLSAQVKSSKRITLSWTDNSSNEAGFKIEQAIGGGTFAVIYTTSKNVTSYTKTGLTANTSYRYRIRAYYGTTYSGYSNVITLSTGPNYYLNTNNKSNGTGTITSPWNIVASVNAVDTFSPGNVIYIARGTRVTGTPTQRRYYPTHPLRGMLTPRGNGSTSASITIDAYDPLDANGQPVTGLPKPIIDAQGADNSASILLYNQECWTIQNLEVTNNATTEGFRSGICIVVDGRTGKTMHNYKIINNSIHDVYGYEVAGGNDQNNNAPNLYDVGGIYIRVFEPDKMDNVLIQGNQVSDVVAEGICFFGSYWTYNHFNVGNVTRNWNNLNTHITIEKNLIQRTQGHGIITWGTDNGLIQYNTIIGAGQKITPAFISISGIETNFSNNGTIQFNEISNTKLGIWDGGAIDVDLYLSGVAYVQYNYTHDNEGGPFEEYGHYWCPNGYNDDDDPNAHSVYRYNISYNDGIKEIEALGSPGYLYDARGNAEIYNNVFYTSFKVVNVTDKNAYGKIKNNIFVLGSQSKILNSDFVYDCGNGNLDTIPGSGCLHSNNLYWCSNGDLSSITITINPVNGLPMNINPIYADPMFVDPVSSGSSGFKLKISSPCARAGITMAKNGGRDYWQTPLYLANTWIGAYQPPPLTPIQRILLH